MEFYNCNKKYLYNNLFSLYLYLFPVLFVLFVMFVSKMKREENDSCVQGARLPGTPACLDT